MFKSVPGAIVTAAVIVAGSVALTGGADRFTLTYVQTGVIRMDKQTGEMEVCSVRRAPADGTTSGGDFGSARYLVECGPRSARRAH